MRLTGNSGVLCALLAVLLGIGLSAGFAQSQTTSRALENLEREFTDPLTTLPQVFLKDAFSPINYGTNVQTNQLVARAIIPRIPPNTLLPFVQLVRPTFSLVTVPFSCLADEPHSKWSGRHDEHTVWPEKFSILARNRCLILFPHEPAVRDSGKRHPIHPRRSVVGSHLAVHCLWKIILEFAFERENMLCHIVSLKASE